MDKYWIHKIHENAGCGEYHCCVSDSEDDYGKDDSIGLIEVKAYNELQEQCNKLVKALHEIDDHAPAMHKFTEIEFTMIRIARRAYEKHNKWKENYETN